MPATLSAMTVLSCLATLLSCPLDQAQAREGAAMPQHAVARDGAEPPATAEADRSWSLQRGLASWYGKHFHGRKTASGEIYDMHAMTAAHPSLPINSLVRVLNIANGREVIVRINDRGPFTGRRIIDLSFAAAAKLGYLARGNARVEIVLLARADATQPAAGVDAVDAGGFATLE